MHELRNKVVYIAGPITNDPDYEVKFGRAAFHLKLKLGVTAVLNPAVLPSGLKSHDAYMRITLAMLAEADAVVFLPDWLSSKGSRMEHIRANELQLPEYELLLHEDSEELKPLAKLTDANCADLIALHQVLEHTSRLWGQS